MDSCTLPVLTQSQQRRTVAGMQNIKKKNKNKVVIKSTLSNPFLLKWPCIKLCKLEEVVNCIKVCFSGLKMSQFVPKWNEVKKLKGVERIEFVKNYKAKELSSVKELECQDLNIIALHKKEALLKQIVLGFNAVMRGIENGIIAGVLVSKNAVPEHLPKSFIPVCNNVHIPLIPVENLDAILKDDLLLGFKHRCMVIGLKNGDAVQPDGRFWLLYDKMLQITECKRNTNNIKENNKPPLDKSSNNRQASSDHDIQSLYLRRSDKSSRVFIPVSCSDAKNLCSSATLEDRQDGANFISLSSEAKSVPEITQPVPSRKRKMVKVSNLSLENFMKLDVTGDDICDQNEKKHKNLSSDGNLIPIYSDGGKRKRKLLEVSEYSSAQIKRIKNNPDRKCGRKR